MIVVIGRPALQEGPSPVPGGRAAEVALAAAAAGARVEVVGRVGDDPAGDQLVLALSRAGIGHAALLRDPSRPTIVLPVPEEAGFAVEADPEARALDDPGPPLEPAEVSMGLRYLGDFTVLVVADDLTPVALRAAVDGARFAGSHLVLLMAQTDEAEPAGEDVIEGLPGDALVLAARGPGDREPAALIGRYAAAVDAGTPPEEAFAGAVGRGWESAAGS